MIGDTYLQKQLHRVEAGLPVVSIPAVVSMIDSVRQCLLVTSLPVLRLRVTSLLAPVRLLLPFYLLMLFSGNVLASDESEKIRGIVSAVHSANLAIDFPARIEKIHKLTGESFVADDTLITFDCRTQSAKLGGARASLKARRIEVKNLVEMARLNAAGEHEVLLAQAEKERASAEVAELEAYLSRCSIKAPYNGKVAELTAAQFENVGVNQQIMRIVNSDELELKLIIPSDWLRWLVVGDPFVFDVDETGKKHQATVMRIGAEVDAISRTVPIFAALVAGDGESLILPGMSGSAVFRLPLQ